MKYEINTCTSKNGKRFYQLYFVVDDKKLYVTSFYESRYNRKAIRHITAKENDK